MYVSASTPLSSANDAVGFVGAAANAALTDLCQANTSPISSQLFGILSGVASSLSVIPDILNQENTSLATNVQQITDVFSNTIDQVIGIINGTASFTNTAVQNALQNANPAVKISLQTLIAESNSNTIIRDVGYVAIATIRFVGAVQDIISTIRATIITFDNPVVAAEVINALVVIVAAELNFVLQIVVKIAVSKGGLSDLAENSFKNFFVTLSGLVKSTTNLVNIITGTVTASETSVLSGLAANVSDIVFYLSGIITSCNINLPFISQGYESPP